ncbi:Alpha/Beta hydrolase protein [Xylariomycetidae sp. FL0641]|nr:Alpha/Beta hydrolase protein [Xylariomycetidae sp. FL0641]
MTELGLSVLPPAAPHTHTVIFLHDRGDTGRDLAGTLFLSRDSYHRTLRDVFPSVRWVFPQAEPRPCERTGEERASQWFDIWNPLDFADREDLQAPGLRDSVRSVRRLVVREARRVKGGLRSIVLAGTGQGGATAVHTLLNLVVPPDVAALSREPPVVEVEEDENDDVDAMDIDDAGPSSSQQQQQGGGGGPQNPGGPGQPQQQQQAQAHQHPLRLAGFVAFASRLPFPGGNLEETREVLGLPEEEGLGPSDEVVRHTPVLLSHCADDPLVFVEYGALLREALRRDLGVREVRWRQYADGGHWINSPAGLDDAIDFLAAQGLPAMRPPRSKFRASVSMSPD